MPLINGDSTLYIENFAFPLRSSLGFSEQWDPVGDVQFVETVNGQTLVLAPPYKRKFDITISVDGNAAWRAPDLHFLQPGDEVILHSGLRQGALIAPGATFVDLPRDAVPGSIIARLVGGSDEIVAHTIVGRRVTIEMQDDYVNVEWKAVAKTYAGDASMAGVPDKAALSWALKLREQAAP